jgi:16S rRNA (guanine527-N7)-methyltransferase
MSLLGGELRRVQQVELSGLPEDRTLVVIEKVSPSPESYPRRAGMPSKRPLRN